MTDQLVADLAAAIDHTMSVFRTMADKVVAGGVTWENIQAELTDDELAVFWSLIRWGESRARQPVTTSVTTQPAINETLLR